MALQFAIIPPLVDLELMNQGRIIFSLGQLCLRYPKYKQFIKQKIEEKWFTILDSGVGDHNDFVDNKQLVDLTAELMPSEVIALDVLFESEKTIDSFNEFIDLMDKAQLLDKVQIMFVPQGRTKDEWVESYLYALEHPLVKTIGMSKLSIPQCFDGKWDNDQNIMQARHKCFDFLVTNDLIHKPLHFLGAGNVIEFTHYNQHPLVRSTDSCFSVLASIYGYQWKSGQTNDRVPTPKDYFTNYSLPKSNQHIFVDNVEVLSTMCGHKTKIHTS